MAADGKTPPTHPQGGAGTLCVHVVSLCADTKTMTCRPCWDTHHTYIPTDRQTDTQAYIHKSIQTYSYTYSWLHMCDVSPLWGGGGEPGGAGSYIHIYIWHVWHICQFVFFFFFRPQEWCLEQRPWRHPGHRREDRPHRVRWKKSNSWLPMKKEWVAATCWSTMNWKAI